MKTERNPLRTPESVMLLYSAIQAVINDNKNKSS